MGASTFETVGVGATAQEAFDKAVTDAKYEHGHGGYSGTIAEKRDFVIIPSPGDGFNVRAYASQLLDENDPRIDDKWGPAGCIALGNGKWLFFGWASS